MNQPPEYRWGNLIEDAETGELVPINRWRIRVNNQGRRRRDGKGRLRKVEPPPANPAPVNAPRQAPPSWRKRLAAAATVGLLAGAGTLTGVRGRRNTGSTRSRALVPYGSTALVPTGGQSVWYGAPKANRAKRRSTALVPVSGGTVNLPRAYRTMTAAAPVPRGVIANRPLSQQMDNYMQRQFGRTIRPNTAKLNRMLAPNAKPSAKPSASQKTGGWNWRGQLDKVAALGVLTGGYLAKQIRRNRVAAQARQRSNWNTSVARLQGLLQQARKNTQALERNLADETFVSSQALSALDRTKKNLNVAWSRSELWKNGMNKATNANIDDLALTVARLEHDLTNARLSRRFGRAELVKLRDDLRIAQQRLNQAKAKNERRQTNQAKAKNERRQMNQTKAELERALQDGQRDATQLQKALGNKKALEQKANKLAETLSKTAEELRKKPPAPARPPPPPPAAGPPGPPPPPDAGQVQPQVASLPTRLRRFMTVIFPAQGQRVQGPTTPSVVIRETLQSKLELPNHLPSNLQNRTRALLAELSNNNRTPRDISTIDSSTNPASRRAKIIELLIKRLHSPTGKFERADFKYGSPKHLTSRAYNVFDIINTVLRKLKLRDLEPVLDYAAQQVEAAQAIINKNDSSLSDLRTQVKTLISGLKDGSVRTKTVMTLLTNNDQKKLFEALKQDLHVDYAYATRRLRNAQMHPSLHSELALKIIEAVLTSLGLTPPSDNWSSKTQARGAEFNEVLTTLFVEADRELNEQLTELIEKTRRKLYLVLDRMTNRVTNPNQRASVAAIFQELKIKFEKFQREARPSDVMQAYKELDEALRVVRQYISRLGENSESALRTLQGFEEQLRAINATYETIAKAHNSARHVETTAVKKKLTHVLPKKGNLIELNTIRKMAEEAQEFKQVKQREIDGLVLKLQALEQTLRNTTVAESKKSTTRGQIKAVKANIKKAKTDVASRMQKLRNRRVLNALEFEKTLMGAPIVRRLLQN